LSDNKIKRVRGLTGKSKLGGGMPFERALAGGALSRSDMMNVKEGSKLE